jgi:hypothetical protein
MSYITTGALGLLAASLAFGGVQFGMASNGSLLPGDASLQQNVSRDVASVVNRSTKADRVIVIPAQADTVTLSFQLRGLKDMSVAMRLPTAEALRLRPAGSAAKANAVARKATFACEPVVSVLTDVAKQLEPGRCIT